jgi:hypothetical protein
MMALSEPRLGSFAPTSSQSQPMNTSIATTSGTPEILLISDSPVNEGHLKYVRRLFGECTSDDDIAFSPGRRTCRWPLRVAHPAGVVDSLSTHVYLCATFLKLRREVVDQIRALGCNLELRLYVPRLAVPLSITASTMKQMSDLQIQLSLIPTSAVDPAPLGGTGGTEGPR